MSGIRFGDEVIAPVTSYARYEVLNSVADSPLSKQLLLLLQYEAKVRKLEHQLEILRFAVRQGARQSDAVFDQMLVVANGGEPISGDG